MEKYIKWEDRVRWCFETIFNNKFIKCRPEWLKDLNSNSNLELDGYCEKLQIAFEFQGPHHYEDYKYLRGKENKITFEQILARDKIKVDKCNELGIKLFIISYKFINSAKKIVLEIERLAKILNIDSKLLNINPDIHYSNRFLIKDNVSPSFIKEQENEFCPIFIYDGKVSKYDHSNYKFSFFKCSNGSSIKNKNIIEIKAQNKANNNKKVIKSKKNQVKSKFISISNRNIKKAEDYLEYLRNKII